MRKSRIHTPLQLLWSSFIAVVVSFSAGVMSSKYTVINPDDIKQTLTKIDSARVSLVGVEPNALGYKPKNAPFDEPTKEFFDTAAVTWRTFVGLCENDKFEEA